MHTDREEGQALLKVAMLGYVMAYEEWSHPTIPCCE